jgi:hypothetical protein
MDIIQLLNVKKSTFFTEKCHCKKSKYLQEQCQNKRKEGSYFCGIHVRSHQKFIYEEAISRNILDIHGNPILLKEREIMKDDSFNEIGEMMDTIVEMKKGKGEEKEYIHYQELLIDLFEKNIQVKVFTLRNIIKKFNLDYFTEGTTKLSRPQLLEYLKKLYILEKPFYQKRNEIKLVKLQRFLRKIIKPEYHLLTCTNETDILTFEDIKDIPLSHIYIYFDWRNKLKYAYDIRTIYYLLQMEKTTCPYTCHEFSKMEKIKLERVVEKYKKGGVSFEKEEIPMTEEQKMNMRMQDIFHKINLLDNYTTFEWFQKLNLVKLYDFYRKAEDIWLYRLQLSKNERQKYVRNGIGFTSSKTMVKHSTNLDFSRNICLDVIERFITQGITREDRKLGAMWMLTALVEVSQEASEALPHLVQYESDED